MLVALVLGTLNSLGLWIIGVDYPLFWGFLASFLAVIPYVGILIGGFLPVIYSFAITGAIWQPLAIITLFLFIQFIEGNIITPRIVGDSVKINPLAAIISLVVGNAIWGMAGLMLAVPILAILRKVMQQIDILRPISLLLSNELYDKDGLFEDNFNKERFRLWNFFRKKKDLK